MGGMASTLVFLPMRHVLRLVRLGPKTMVPNQMTRTSGSQPCATSWRRSPPGCPSPLRSHRSSGP